MNLALVTEILAWGLLTLAFPGTFYLAVLTVAGAMPSLGHDATPLAGRLAFVTFRTTRHVRRNSVKIRHSSPQSNWKKNTVP